MKTGIALTDHSLPLSSGSLFLGLDGGQSHTRVIIAGATGQILARGSAGPANCAAVAAGRARLIQAVTEAVGQALAEVGRRLATTRFTAACCGFSGGPGGKRDLLAELLPADYLEVVTDAQIALWGATGGEPGIVVIAGTGAIAFGQNTQGETARAGGWGYIFGDEDGAFGSANELMHRFYTDEYPRDKFAALAPLVGKAAAKGDASAREILVKAAHHLASLASAVQGQLFQGEPAVSVAPVGGVFQDSLVAREFAKALESLTDSGRQTTLVTRPKFEPVAGALRRALLLAGIDFGQASTANLKTLN